MYLNYGDINFANNGRLVEQVGKHQFNIVTCEHMKNGKFLVCECFVDTKDSMVDMDDVYAFAGIEDYSPIDFAVGCIDYYGPEAFCNYRHRYELTADEVKELLKKIEHEDELTVE